MRTDLQMKIRLPVEMKDWLARQAEQNLRSMTQEIVLSIRERMERMKTVAGESFQAHPATAAHDPALQGGPTTQALEMPR